jgi:hypothetical protein
MNRAELEDAMAENTLEDMDWNTLHQMAYTALTEKYSKMTDAEFSKLVQDFAPHLLDDEDEEEEA